MTIPNPKERKKGGPTKRRRTIPLLARPYRVTAEDVASSWLGLGLDEQNVMHLQQLNWLLDADYKVHFRTDAERNQMTLQSEKHAGSMPMALGRAVVGLLGVRRALDLLEIEACCWIELACSATLQEPPDYGRGVDEEDQIFL